MKWPDDFINKIICGDCLEVMKDIPDKAVDLIITSPPYNMGGKSLGYKPQSKISHKHYDVYNDNQDEQKYILWIISVIRECLRTSRYVFWNIQYVRSTRNLIYEIQTSFKDNLKDIFIWEKQAVSNITAKNGGMAKGWEYVFMFGEDNLSTFPYNNFPDNGYVPNIKTWFKSENFKEHAATFPRDLPMYFIQYFTKTNDLILDPFSGTHTTARAAKDLMRRFIGIEISQQYCNIAERRLSQEVLF